MAHFLKPAWLLGLQHTKGLKALQRLAFSHLKFFTAWPMQNWSGFLQALLALSSLRRHVSNLNGDTTGNSDEQRRKPP